MRRVILQGSWQVWVALVTLPLLSCLEPESVVCPSGRVCRAGLACAAVQDTCIETSCGDGIVQEQEACDDGNIQNGDGCSRDCQSDETCGNGRVDEAVGEVCDDGNREAGDACSPDCKSTEFCGNGILDEALKEVCDDDNNVDGDGCSADCRSNERCGNLVVDNKFEDPGLREVCDDGNVKNGDGCSSDCRSDESCGNGIRDPKEECDNGAPISTVTCDADCTRAMHGDRFVNEALGEECDDGNFADEDDCLSTFKWNVCGDGVTNLQGTKVEACDDGNEVTEEGCPYGVATCTACREDCGAVLHLQGAFCGDGTRDDSEACDDGNNLACGTCNADCTRAQGAHAVGSIKVIERANVVDVCVRGKCFFDSFSLSDGLGDKVTFEFDTDEHVEADHVRIDLTHADTEEEVAVATASAINSVGDSLRISAASEGGTVILTHDEVGSFGNQRIAESVWDRSFNVTDMAGGVGADCPVQTPCHAREDCQPNLTCDAGRCVPPPSSGAR
ncbi:DUF4215 domain-containing protein [Hyalangium versicolor]|uniref:DUF4215 domain-containing protein n=1 Tax=Hyalangium versicolor TaxID=2861190 RepID=UPI001CCDE9D4